MKKRTVAVLAILMAMALIVAGCGSSNSDSGSSDKKTYKIGIVQIVEHESLDTIRESIISELEKEGYKDGDNIEIDYQNAQNDQNNLKTICQNFTSDKKDLIVAIATPSAQAALGETTQIPIIFSAVTDPVGSKLVKSEEKPGGNITGTSDRVSAARIMELAKKITPDIKTVGALYNSGETNSVAVVDELKSYAEKNGIKVVEAAVQNSSDIQQSAQSLTGKVDAVFSPIDNTVASSMPVVTDVLNKAKIPFYVSADSMVKDGGLATCGIDYKTLGQETAKMAVKVLKGEKTEDMPVQVMKEVKVYVNSKTAQDIGVAIPEDIMKDATDLGEK